ncbi:MAG: branched-chain-amino-acid transaminase [Candidatus Ratteibacteria bacterium]
MSLIIYLDGNFVEEKDAKISVFDHGLLYGDGVFEGIRSYGGKIFRMEEHIQRLYRSAHALMLDIPMSQKEMMEVVAETVRVNSLQDAYIRAVVTRGIGDLGLDPMKCKTPTVFVIASKITLYPEELYEKGLTIQTVATRRNSPESLNPSIKSLNYLNNILAKIEANNTGGMEGLILNSEGYVVECTADNIFLVNEGTLLTPPISSGALEGITRGAVLEAAEFLGIPCAEPLLTRYNVYNAQECFLTGTAAEMIPVVKVDGRSIGSGEPGPITIQLRERFKEMTRTGGYRAYPSTEE